MLAATNPWAEPRPCRQHHALCEHVVLGSHFFLQLSHMTGDDACHHFEELAMGVHVFGGDKRHVYRERTDNFLFLGPAVDDRNADEAEFLQLFFASTERLVEEFLIIGQARDGDGLARVENPSDNAASGRIGDIGYLRRAVREREFQVLGLGVHDDHERPDVLHVACQNLEQCVQGFLKRGVRLSVPEWS